MSDFIFSSKPQPVERLAGCIRSIYHTNKPTVQEYRGEWGALAVSRNLHGGLQPLETTRHIFVVIGGPLLCFRDNCFLTENDPIAGTRAIYERWVAGRMLWDEDLSGPFVILAVDKVTRTMTCVTDLMMFIPVYKCENEGARFIGTHVDALAIAAGQTGNLDPVALVDFVINHVVTHPYSVYSEIKQAFPASVLVGGPDGFCEPQIYWLPYEINPYENIGDAAHDLRKGLQAYVNQVTESMQEVAQFLSAGEDSRAIAGMLPQSLKRDGYIFLDNMNREGKIAIQVAAAYGLKISAVFRSPTHYLDILEEASELVGSGHQYIHAHALRFDKSCDLGKYPAVFGGYLADSLLKAVYTRKASGLTCQPFVPQFFLPGETQTRPIHNPFIGADVLEEINRRRRVHMQKICVFRKTTIHEWFELWPATMRVTIPNLYSNRRLFRSYEPFMCKQVVKIAAAVPTSWKLNRRLFHKSMHQFLRPGRKIFHADGRLPYYPWWLNCPIQFFVLFFRRILILTRSITGNQGPWSDFQAVVKSDKWRNAIVNLCQNDWILNQITRMDVKELFEGSRMSIAQQVNLLQALYAVVRSGRLGGRFSSTTKAS